jgi:large conductance mechanosensitive channel
MRGFRAFLLRGNVVDLAVAVVVGAAFSMVVSAFVKDVITPLIAAMFGKPEFANLYFTINNSKFLYGDFLNALISFFIAAAVIYYFVVLPINALIERSHRHDKPADPTTKKCPECLSEIPIDAKRCAFCTQPQPA